MLWNETCSRTICARHECALQRSGFWCSFEIAKLQAAQEMKGKRVRHWVMWETAERSVIQQRTRTHKQVDARIGIQTRTRTLTRADVHIHEYVHVHEFLQTHKHLSFLHYCNIPTTDTHKHAHESRRPCTRISTDTQAPVLSQILQWFFQDRHAHARPRGRASIHTNVYKLSLLQYCNISRTIFFKIDMHKHAHESGHLYTRISTDTQVPVLSQILEYFQGTVSACPSIHYSNIHSPRMSGKLQQTSGSLDSTRPKICASQA